MVRRERQTDRHRDRERQTDRHGDRERNTERTPSLPLWVGSEEINA